jgi:nucleoside-diphosphate-sugar epimerase
VPPNVTHLVFSAAPDQGSEESYRRVYLDGFRHVLAALREAGAPLERVVFVSSTTVSDGKGALILAAEALALEHPGGVVARLAGIYGPGRERLIRMVREGSARCSVPSPIGNRIHRDDAAGMIDHLLRLPAPARCYLGVDDAPVALSEVYTWIASRLGLPPPPTSSEPDARGRGAFKRCLNARLRQSGYSFLFPTYREGYGAMLSASGAG